MRMKSKKTKAFHFKMNSIKSIMVMILSFLTGPMQEDGFVLLILCKLQWIKQNNQPDHERVISNTHLGENCTGKRRPDG